FNVTAQQFRQFYYAERNAYDRSAISAEQYWSAIAADAGTQLSADQITWLRGKDVEMWSNINPEMLEWAARLRAHGIETAVLSNMHEDMAKAVRERFDWIAEFRCFTLSAELQLAKPDPRIFQHCLDCLNVAARESIFIDDKQQNTRAAEQLGITGICASSAAEIRERLQAAGWTGPPL
ncbi:MAG: HAD family phosphatase, partial [Candidatus Eremiobacteraeota bacterium]|nr:HAD family phosphatase [Candidatus Eremiobacteraeota bacterium]